MAKEFLENTLCCDSVSKKEAAEEFINGEIKFFTFLRKVENIERAFTWSCTPQGHGFWSRLHKSETNQLISLWDDYKILAKKH